VEFALVLPVFFTLVLGMFTGGLAYNRKLALTQASREAVRYGATLPVVNFATMAGWLDAVAAVAVRSAEGELSSGAPGRSVCVAYVFQPGTSQTSRRMESGTAPPTYDVGSGCFTDGRPSTETRVQVVTSRTSKLEALVFSQDLVLRSEAVSRFEAMP
jgi:Flp pilus assembly protein TadG